ncbi:MAG: hypothetical protein K940chlam3_00277 [Chlamydiae bacterium]|nr:hypothetical protein [Chlamydiota bacterium]
MSIYNEYQNMWINEHIKTIELDLEAIKEAKSEGDKEIIPGFVSEMILNFNEIFTRIDDWRNLEVKNFTSLNSLKDTTAKVVKLMQDEEIIGDNSKYLFDMAGNLLMSIDTLSQSNEQQEVTNIDKEMNSNEKQKFDEVYRFLELNDAFHQDPFFKGIWKIKLDYALERLKNNHQEPSFKNIYDTLVNIQLERLPHDENDPYTAEGYLAREKIIHDLNHGFKIFA